MSRIDKEIIVDAPIDSVFAFVTNPNKILTIWHSLIDVENRQPIDSSGYKTAYEFRMGGMKFKGKAVCTELVTNRWMVIHTKGISHSTITCTFRAVKDDPARPRTRMTLTIEYEVPVPLLGNIAEYIIVKMSDDEAELVMKNIRTSFINK